MFMCVLHCLWDQEDPWGVVGQFRDAVAPGSYLALSHMTGEAHPEAAAGLFYTSPGIALGHATPVFRVIAPSLHDSSTGSR